MRRVTGSRLKVARMRRGISEDELGYKLGVLAGQIRRWEDEDEALEDQGVIDNLVFILRFPVAFFFDSPIRLIDESRISFRRGA